MMEKQKTVLLGMSGGVDSSVAALLLQREEYDVIGAFMKNYSDTKNALGECAWRDELRMARRVAAKLGIKLIVIDAEKEYKKDVIEPMFRDYGRGLTPNPDILCNTIIKFPFLWKVARENGADFIATGHYVRIRSGKNGFELLRGVDSKKDQSYFLCGLTQKDLSHTIFPIGDLTKDEVKTIARKEVFPNWDKPGTRGICFVGKQDMKKFLGKKIKRKKGKILDLNGEVVGEHEGAAFFTVGERVGEKYAAVDPKFRNLNGKKLYVAEKKGNAIVIVPEGSDALKRKEVFLRKIHFINPQEKIPSNLNGRIRHLGELHAGRLIRCMKKYSAARDLDSQFRAVASLNFKGASRRHVLFNRNSSDALIGRARLPKLRTSESHLRVERAAVRATLRNGLRYKFVFSQPVGAIAEGQYLVLYSGEKVVACGEMRFR